MASVLCPRLFEENVESHLEVLERLDPYPDGQVLAREVRPEREQSLVRRLEVEARDGRAFLDLFGDLEGGESGPWCGSSDLGLKLCRPALSQPAPPTPAATLACLTTCPADTPLRRRRRPVTRPTRH
jgi:hypothetical protein